ncbi:uncharacterized protein MYCGRDRAFT_103716 [Zymoseptoria tritici IPO323]|uniref:Secreted protein n=1 Tax=Zymoseptoria tritici (strain CBS 115943 / IPO323) TaxID=336722 RepID=F9X521_ZYMTI|nr:uncharacterized protein MYCGRDRAFT_103716 [Zymoseptoria tritici IPO323]EGP88807.1 hypothetical protein MYCGRDRAFT_103716 [Zymoseptoria tritici IPO323]
MRHTICTEANIILLLAIYLQRRAPAASHIAMPTFRCSIPMAHHPTSETLLSQPPTPQALVPFPCC